MQTRDHMFKWCKKWKRQQDNCWKRLRKTCKWKERMKVPIFQTLNRDDAVQAILKFIKEIDVGRVSGVREGVVKEG